MLSGITLLSSACLHCTSHLSSSFHVVFWCSLWDTPSGDHLLCCIHTLNRSSQPSVVFGKRSSCLLSTASFLLSDSARFCAPLVYPTDAPSPAPPSFQHVICQCSCIPYANVNPFAGAQCLRVVLFSCCLFDHLPPCLILSILPVLSKDADSPFHLLHLALPNVADFPIHPSTHCGHSSVCHLWSGHAP